MSEYRQELAAEMIEAFNNIGSRVDISEPEECEAIFDLIESKGFAIVPRETVDALQQRVGELDDWRKALTDIEDGLRRNWTNEPNNQRKIAYVAALGVVEKATKGLPR